MDFRSCLISPSLSLWLFTRNIRCSFFTHETINLSASNGSLMNLSLSESQVNGHAHPVVLNVQSSDDGRCFFYAFGIVANSAGASHKINQLESAVKTTGSACRQGMTWPAVKSPKTVGVR